MSGMKTPRRKRRVYQQVDSPFPIPIESITNKPVSDHRWFYYTGHLTANCVLVQQQGDVIFLYKMGFFGKGMLSKSKPEHGIFLNSYQGLRKKNLPPKERRFQQQRFQQVRKHRYERHLSWHKQFVKQSQEAAQMDVKSSSPSDEQFVKQSQEAAQMDVKSSSPSDKQFVKQSQEAAQMDVKSSSTSYDNDCGCIENRINLPKENKTKQEAAYLTKDEVCKDESRLEGCITEEDDECTESDDITAETDDVRVDYEMKEPNDVTPATDDVTTMDVNKTCDEVTDRIDNERTENKQRRWSEASVTMETSDLCCQETRPSVSSSTLPEQDVAGTNDESEDQGFSRKDDPYKIHEYLQLKLEEAFFLSYGLGCLSVMDENKKALDLTEMWQIFCSRQRNFVATYVAYHYYRSKGWVPRDGVKYGAHFVLYKHGPPFYHGSYSVIVQMVNEGSWASHDATNAMTWPALSGMDRITETVAKEVMFCYVLRPPHLSDQEIMRSPKCIPQFTVQEIVMRRWVSSRERDLKEQLPPLIS